VARFWIGVLLLVVTVAAVGYPFLSLLFPETTLVLQHRFVRFAVLFVALLGTGALVWSAVLSDSAKAPSAASGNRNR